MCVLRNGFLGGPVDRGQEKKFAILFLLTSFFSFISFFRFVISRWIKVSAFSSKSRKENSVFFVKIVGEGVSFQTHLVSKLLIHYWRSYSFNTETNFGSSFEPVIDISPITEKVLTRNFVSIDFLAISSLYRTELDLNFIFWGSPAPETQY